MIDEARDRDGSSDALRNDSDHISNSFPLVQARLDSIAHLDRRRRLRGLAVDLHMPRTARSSGVGARLRQANRPQPLVNPRALHISILHQKLAICRDWLA